MIILSIFDMDGLLLNTERQVWSIGEKTIAKQYGKEMTDEIIAEVIGINNVEYRKIIKEKFGNDFPVADFQKELNIYYENACKSGIVSLMPGALELLNFLKEKNFYISLGTSTDRKLVEIALKKSGIFQYFDYIVCGDEVQSRKPSPEVYLKSVEHFNLNPEECIVFEDTPVGAKWRSLL